MIGEACNAFGIDYERLVLEVDYQSKDRLRVHIYDADRAEYISASLIRAGGAAALASVVHLLTDAICLPTAQFPRRSLRHPASTMAST
jgi:hypothetical protein